MFQRLAVVFAFAVPLAHATILIPGSTAAPSAVSIGSTPVSPDLSDTIVNGPLSARYETFVYADPANVFCGNCLNFIYVIGNRGAGVISRVTMFNFGGILVNAGYANVPIVNAFDPTSVDRSADGGTVGFTFAPGLSNGQNSFALVIQTNATAYTSGVFSIQNGTIGTITGFQPAGATVTPEPGTAFLLGVGAVAVFRLRSRIAAR